MSDGTPLQEIVAPFDPADCDREPPPFAHAERPTGHQTEERFKSDEFLQWLPRLGPVLWLHHPACTLERHPVRPSKSTLLVEHPAIACVSSCSLIRANQVINPQGPREWLSFHASDGSTSAKLFLLPDSDVLAWDQMCLARKFIQSDPTDTKAPSHAHFLRRALGRLGQRWQAHLLEFHYRQHAWLSVFGAQPPLRISLLGLDIVQRIARDENADWTLPSRLP